MRPFYITSMSLFSLNEKHKKKSTSIINYIAFQVSNLYCTSRMLQCPCPNCLKLKPPFDLCIWHRIPSWLEIGLCCWSCSARYTAGRQAQSAQLQESSKSAGSCRIWQKPWFLCSGHSTEIPLAGSGSSSDHPIWASQPRLLRRWSSRSRRASDMEKMCIKLSIKNLKLI